MKVVTENIYPKTDEDFYLCEVDGCDWEAKKKIIRLKDNISLSRTTDCSFLCLKHYEVFKVIETLKNSGVLDG